MVNADVVDGLNELNKEVNDDVDDGLNELDKEVNVDGLENKEDEDELKRNKLFELKWLEIFEQEELEKKHVELKMDELKMDDKEDLTTKKKEFATKKKELGTKRNVELAKKRKEELAKKRKVELEKKKDGDQELEKKMDDDVLEMTPTKFLGKQFRRKRQKSTKLGNYTDLSGNFFKLNDPVTVNPILDSDIEQMDELNNWMKLEEVKDEDMKDLVTSLAGQDLFDRLLKPQNWIHDKEIDASCFLLRKRVA
ncbi:ribosomal RNA-processing protein 14-like [Impatiens glandulifera]|uniref:ribosomal RNA-processing protein 14-like n=1 Tax=Impatiens glandulifera TaxID=253017 RepID=UPI001FB0CD8B|nr:ribosomal RNA-processing protein 14-like [Impatiens glandulifera]